MELTNELKRGIFSLYIGNKVICDGKEWILMGVTTSSIKNESPTLLLYEVKKFVTSKGVLEDKILNIVNYDSDLCTLELRPLSSITEEEFKVMVRRNYPKDGMVIFNVDYLRSIRIAIPFMGIPVEQWIEWGVVKLKEA